MQTSSPKGENGADHDERAGADRATQPYGNNGEAIHSCTPPSNGGWTAQKNVIHIWPRHSYMLIGFPNTDGSFTCSLHIPFEGPFSFDSIRSERELLGLSVSPSLPQRNSPNNLRHSPNESWPLTSVPDNAAGANT